MMMMIIKMILKKSRKNKKIDKQTESSSNANTPPKVKSLNSQKTSPLSLSSGYDDDSSSSESYIDKLKKIFPNLDLD